MASVPLLVSALNSLSCSSVIFWHMLSDISAYLSFAQISLSADFKDEIKDGLLMPAIWLLDASYSAYSYTTCGMNRLKSISCTIHRGMLLSFEVWWLRLECSSSFLVYILLSAMTSAS